MLCAIRVKFDVLVSFFINGKNQEEGSSAISVKRRMNNKSWQVWLVIMAPHIQRAFYIYIVLSLRCGTYNNLERQAGQVQPDFLYR